MRHFFYLGLRLLENRGQSLHIGLVYIRIYRQSVSFNYNSMYVHLGYVSFYITSIYITICLSMKFDRTTIVGHLYIVMMVNTSTSEDLTGVCAAIYSFSPYPYNLYRCIILLYTYIIHTVYVISTHCIRIYAVYIIYNILYIYRI